MRQWQNLPGRSAQEVRDDLLELEGRRLQLIQQAIASEKGDEEETLIYETPFRKPPVLVRREVHRRIARSAAVAYWREIRATESTLKHLADELALLEGTGGKLEVLVTLEPGPEDPRNTPGTPDHAAAHGKADGGGAMKGR